LGWTWGWDWANGLGGGGWWWKGVVVVGSGNCIDSWKAECWECWRGWAVVRGWRRALW
jgi:hypothetical protein